MKEKKDEVLSKISEDENEIKISQLLFVRNRIILLYLAKRMSVAPWEGIEMFSSSSNLAVLASNLNIGEVVVYLIFPNSSIEVSLCRAPTR